MNAHPGALQFVAARLADGIRPKPKPTFLEWLPRNIVLVDGEHRGDFWSVKRAPYLGPIAEVLDPSHPAPLVTVRKCQQSGVSILAMAWALFLAEHYPDNILYGVPGRELLADMNDGKLQPLIDEWQRHTGKRIIAPIVSRSGTGSKGDVKRFPGGYLNLANAGVAKDLSGKTTRFGVKDEVSKWEPLTNGADPETLFFGRFTAFRRTKSYKIFELSTPEYDTGDPLGEEPGHCRIDRSFRRSDQRYWFVRCPECDHEFVQREEGLEVNIAHPHKSTYICPSCAHRISETERIHMVRAGRYIASETAPDRHPGFHVDAFMSFMMSYEAIAEDYLRAEKGSDTDQKDYQNLTLALPAALAGDAPDYKRLMERREDYPQGVVPADGLIFVGGADIGHNEIYVELVAFASDRQSWNVRAEILPGATDDPKAGAWTLLDTLFRESYKDAYGNDRKIEALAVDAGDGNRITQAYEWCRVRPNAYAIKGMPGKGVPAIGLPQKRSVRKGGKRQKYNGAQLWPVGTWSLKKDLMACLNKTGILSGEEQDPIGYCHFGTWLDEEFFRQITSEYFRRENVRGRLVERWEPIRRDNHFLDCRVYAMAMAEHLGLSRLTADGWSQLRAKYAVVQADLLSSEPEKIAAATAMNPPKKSKESGTIRDRAREWSRRR